MVVINAIIDHHNNRDNLPKIHHSCISLERDYHLLNRFLAYFLVLNTKMKFSLTSLVVVTAPVMAWSFSVPRVQTDISSSSALKMAEGDGILNKYSR